ncbi:MAG: AbgT family transporter [Verrucomicrobiae bacterium]|nr:AbgT family transporter [Verrucomicrobiae bacterium]
MRKRPISPNHCEKCRDSWQSCLTQRRRSRKIPPHSTISRPFLPLGTLISIMLPYSLAFSIGWSVMLIVWFLTGWPLGPGAPMLLPG